MKLDEIKQAVVDLEEDRATRLVQEALDEGLDAREVLENGVLAGLREVGILFQNQEYFLAELMLGAKAVEKCMVILKPRLPKAEGPKRGVVVIGAVQGDLHSIAVSLVARQLELAGYEVHVAGVNVPSMTFIDIAREVKADIIGLSAFLVTTIPMCNEVIRYLRDMGLRDQFKVIIGGAGTSQAVADTMGADGWAANAIDAVKLCDKLLAKEAVA